ncbi:triacylglycerol lipase 2-like isoform X2 [Aristolochia californica]|uniref:triacylglycerol lipase 2-like isoform X2 n=1 Tax=Aristolochia californica TaxID=171875 RepID=UPI0035D895B8
MNELYTSMSIVNEILFIIPFPRSCSLPLPIFIFFVKKMSKQKSLILLGAISGVKPKSLLLKYNVAMCINLFLARFLEDWLSHSSIHTCFKRNVCTAATFFYKIKTEQAGVRQDGMTWLLNSPEQSLAFVLADSGYDVWIANTRGTRFSQGHATLDASTPAYWAWSWDELVEFDLPATFDFVYRQTGQKINYVGHSLLVDQLKSAALLSPIAYLSHMTTKTGQLAARAFVGEMVTWLGIAEFNPKGRAVQNFLNALCANPGVDCYDLMSSFTGKNCCLNESTADTFLKYEPESSSTKNMVHLAQSVRDGIIKKFDYGNHDMNVRYYGQGKPPIYNMSNIPNNLPLFLSYGGQDALSDVRDVELLLDNLKFHDGDKLTVQYVKDYAHADFVMGVTAKRIVYDAIVAFFNRQER